MSFISHKIIFIQDFFQTYKFPFKYDTLLFAAAIEMKFIEAFLFSIKMFLDPAGITSNLTYTSVLLKSLSYIFC